MLNEKQAGPGARLPLAWSGEGRGAGVDGADRSLLERCAAGDQSAWRHIVKTYAGVVYAIARAHGLSGEACDDVAQACFAALATHVGRIADDRAIAAWLRTTATREAWRTVRQQRRAATAPLMQEPDGSTLEQRMEAIEQHRLLREALEELGGRCRDLLRLLYFGPEHNAYERVESELGLPHGSIGPTRRRCLDKLARIMEPEAGNG